MLVKTSMYRYFNPNPSVSRMPEPAFLNLFAEYLQLTEVQTIALHYLWLLKRTLRQ